MTFMEKMCGGLNILKKYSLEASLEYVPNTFSNGAPNNPNTLYVQVEMPFEAQLGVNKRVANKLIGLGWRMEGDGDFWVLYS